MAINENYIEYYQYLEAIRKSGITNMWGAAPYLVKEFDEISWDDAEEILVTWIKNYDELNKIFGWQ